MACRDMRSEQADLLPNDNAVNFSSSRANDISTLKEDPCLPASRSKKQVNHWSKRMPVFGSFPGPPDEPAISNPASVADSDEELSLPGSLPVEIGVSTTSQDISPVDNTDVSCGPLPNDCSRTDPVHGPPAEPRLPLYSLEGRRCLEFGATPVLHNNEHKGPRNSRGHARQSDACRQFETKPWNNYPPQNCFVRKSQTPGLSFGQRDWRFDHVFDSGKAHQSHPRFIEHDCAPPHEPGLPRYAAAPVVFPVLLPATAFEPAILESNMCQDYTQNATWCMNAMPFHQAQPFSPPGLSPAVSFSSCTSTPSTTPLSSTFALKSPPLQARSSNPYKHNLPFRAPPTPTSTPTSRTTIISTTQHGRRRKAEHLSISAKPYLRYDDVYDHYHPSCLPEIFESPALMTGVFPSPPPGLPLPHAYLLQLQQQQQWQTSTPRTVPMQDMCPEDAFEEIVSGMPRCVEDFGLAGKIFAGPLSATSGSSHMVSKDRRPRNELLAELVRSSEPLGYHAGFGNGGSSRWGAIGMPVPVSVRP